MIHNIHLLMYYVLVRVHLYLLCNLGVGYAYQPPLCDIPYDTPRSMDQGVFHLHAFHGCTLSVLDPRYHSSKIYMTLQHAYIIIPHKYTIQTYACSKTLE